MRKPLTMRITTPLVLLLIGCCSMNAQELWQTIVGTPANRAITHTLADLPNGDIVTAGIWDTPRLKYPQAVVRCYSPTGELRWQTILTARNHGLEAHATHALPNGEVLVAATRSDGELVVLRLDAQGRERDRIYPVPGAAYTIYQVLPLQDGGLLLGGQGRREGRPSFALVRLDAALQVVWTRNLINLDSDEPTYCAQLLEYANGDLLAFGRSGGRYALFRFSADNDLRYGRSALAPLDATVSLGTWHLLPDQTVLLPGGYPGNYQRRVAFYRIDPTGNIARVGSAQLFRIQPSRPTLDQVRIHPDGSLTGIAYDAPRPLLLTLDSTGTLLDSVHVPPVPVPDFTDPHRRRLVLADGGYAMLHSTTTADSTSVQLTRYTAALQTVHRTVLDRYPTDTDDALQSLAVAPDGTSLVLSLRDSTYSGTIHSATGQPLGKIETTSFDPAYRPLLGAAIRREWWVLTRNSNPGIADVVLQRFDRSGRPLGTTSLPTQVYSRYSTSPAELPWAYTLANGNVLIRGLTKDLLLDRAGVLLHVIAGVHPVPGAYNRYLTPDRNGGYYSSYAALEDGTAYLRHYGPDGTLLNTQTVPFGNDTDYWQVNDRPVVNCQLFYPDASATLRLATHYVTHGYQHRVLIDVIDPTTLRPTTREHAFDLFRANGNFSYGYNGTPFRLQPTADGIWVHVFGQSLLVDPAYTVRYAARIDLQDFGFISFSNEAYAQAAGVAENGRYYRVFEQPRNQQTDLRLVCYGLEDFHTPPPPHLTADTTLQLRLYPNPATAQSNLYLDDPTRGSVTLDLIDATGRARWHLRREKDQELFQQAIPLRGLPRGTYWLHVRDAQGKRSIALVVQ